MGELLGGTVHSDDPYWGMDKKKKFEHGVLKEEKMVLRQGASILEEVVHLRS